MMAQNHQNDVESAETPKTKRKHRLLKVIAAVVVLVIVLAALAPTLLSTGPGEAWIRSRAAGQINGTLEFDDLSLGWFSGVDLTGLRIRDRQGRAVITADTVSVDTGLLSLATSPSKVGQVRVDRLRAVLYVGPEGQTSLQDVFESDEPAPKPEGQPLPEILRQLRLALRLRDAEIRTVRADGREQAMTIAHLNVDVDELNDILVDLDAELAEGQLLVEAHVQDLLTDGRISAQRVRASGTVRTPRALQVAPAAQFALAGPTEASGSVSIEADFELGDGDVTSRFSTQVRQLRLAGAGAPRLDADLAGSVARTEETLILIDGLQAVLHVGPDGQVSLARLVRPEDPPASGSRGPLPDAVREMQLQFRMRNADIRAVGPDGQERTVAIALLDIRVDQLNDILLELDAQLAQGRVLAQTRLQQLLTDGRISPEALRASGTVRTEQPIDLAAAAALAMVDRAPATGRVGLAADFRYADGAVETDFDTHLHDVRLARADALGGSTVEAELAGSYRSAEGNLVVIDNLQAVIRRDAAGGFHLADLQTPAGGDEPGPLPEAVQQLQLALRMRDAAFRTVDPHGGEDTVTIALLSADVNRLEDILYELDAQLAGGQVVASGQVQDLLTDGRPSVERLRASGQVRTASPLQVATLASWAGGGADEAGGSLAVDGQFAYAGGNIQTRFDTQLRALRLAQVETPGEVTLDADLTGTVSTRGDIVSAQVSLTSPDGAAHPLGHADWDVQLDRATLADRSDGTTLARALMTGSEADWPAVKGSAEVDLNLATILNAVPAAVGLVDQLVVEQARLAVDGQFDTAAETPQLRYNFELSEMTVRQGQQRRTFQPVRGRLVTSLPPGEPLNIAEANILSDFLTLDGQGRIDDFDARLQANLVLLKQRMGITRFGQRLVLAGQVDTTARIARPNPERMDLSIDGSASGLRVGRLGQDPQTVEQGRFGLAGSLHWTEPLVVEGADPNQPERLLQRVVLDELMLEADGQRLDGALALDWLDTRLEHYDLTITRPGSVVTLAGSADWSDEADAASLRVDTTVNATIIDEDDTRRTVQPINLLAQVNVDKSAKVATVEQFQAQGEALTLALTGTVAEYDSRRVLDLQGIYSGQDEALTDLIAALRADPNREIQLQFPEGRISHPIRITGPVSDPNVTPGYRNVHLATAVSWQSISVPGWDIGKMDDFPIELTDGQIALPAREIELNEGLARTDGVIHLFGPGNDGQEGLHPRLVIPGELMIIENITVTQQVSTNLLGLLNPAFRNPQDVSGQTSVRLSDVDLPLGEGLTERGSIAAGRLDITQFSMAPTGLMSQILQALGRRAGGTGQIQIPGVDFELRDGRVYYDNFLLVWENLYHLKFSGSVGLDKTLELAVHLPITPELLSMGLERLPNVPVLTPVLVDNLQDTYVPVPITGTSGRPELRLDQVGELLQPMIEQVIRNFLRGGLQGGNLIRNPLDRIGDILNTSQQPSQLPQPSPTED